MNSQIHTEKHRPFPIPETNGYMYIYIYYTSGICQEHLGALFIPQAYRQLHVSLTQTLHGI